MTALNLLQMLRNQIETQVQFSPDQEMEMDLSGTPKKAFAKIKINVEGKEHVFRVQVLDQGFLQDLDVASN